MRNALLILIFITLTANMCPPIPYRAKTLYKKNKTDSNKVELKNGLTLTFKFSDLDWNHQHVGVAVFCDLYNPTPLVQILDRKDFSIILSPEILFQMTPMQVAYDLHFSTVSDEYPVAPLQNTDYVFIFYSKNKFSKQEAVDFLKMDTVYFLFHAKESVDSLFKIVGNDRRINRL